jgi:Predicted integral membrane protein
MASITESIDVNVPVSTAYNQWTQFETFPQFLNFVDAVTQIDDVTNRWSVTIGGVQREFVTKITEQHPDERVAWNSTGGEVDHAGVVTFHRLDDNTTRVTVQLDWEPESLREKIGAAVGIDDHAVRKDLGKFKEFIESRGAATGAWRGDVD